MLGVGWHIRILSNGAVLVRASDAAPPLKSSGDVILDHLSSLADCLEVRTAVPPAWCTGEVLSLAWISLC